MPAGRWPEFEIATIEPGRRAVLRYAPRYARCRAGTCCWWERISHRGGALPTNSVSPRCGASACRRWRRRWPVFWFSYKLARRVGEVTSTCQRIMAGETGLRLPVAGANDEFDALAAVGQPGARSSRGAGRHAARDLRQHRARSARAAAPAAHPHGRVAAALTAARAGGARVDRVGIAGSRSPAAHARTLLQIALAESGAPLASAASVDVAELAAELVELFEPVAAAQRLTLACRRDAPAIVQGNRQLLAQLLTNLIENGLKYVPAGGRIEVAVRA